MQEIVAVQQKLVPDLLDVMKVRYRILQVVRLNQPIGRRGLAMALGMTERVTRAEVDFLKSQGLVHVDAVGMRLTNEGEQIAARMEMFVDELEERSPLEIELARVLRLTEAIVVPGDADSNPYVLRDIGYRTAMRTQKLLRDGDTLAVTGGTTIALVADMMPESTELRQIEVVPARGGLGEQVELQANTIASRIAMRLHGTYKMLHLPDQMRDATYATLLQEPHVQERLSMIRQARIVLHGIGQARHMAKRRQLPEEVLAELEERQAVAETFGYYFNRRGEVVYMTNSVGLRIDDLDRVEWVIAVAGGGSKAEAITAVARGCKLDVLVTDESAAQQVLALAAAES